MLLLTNILVIIFFFFRKQNLLHRYIVFILFFLMYMYISNLHHICIYRSTSINSDPFAWHLLTVLNDSYASISLLFFIYVLMTKLKNILTVLICSIVYLVFKKTIIMSSFSGFLLNSNINVTLMNSLLLFHPVYLYISYVFMLLIFILNFNNIIMYRHSHTINTVTLTKKYVKNFALYSSIALLLGCWWAQQELNWGGWWNWDAIEIIALLLYMLSLLMLHLYGYKNYVHLGKFAKLTPYCILFFYLLSRQDLINSIHSFIIIGAKDMYVEYKLILVFIIWLFILYNTKKYLVNSVIIIFIVTFIYLYLYVLYNSLNLLINNVVYVTEFKVVKYVFIFITLSLYLFVGRTFLPIIYFLSAIVFLSTWYEFIVFSLFFLFLNNLLLNKSKFSTVLLHISYLFIMYSLLYVSNLDFYFYKSSRFITYNVHYNNLYFLDHNNFFFLKLFDNIYKYIMQYYTYNDALLNKPYSILTQFRNQIIYSNGIVNLNFVFFKKTLTLAQTWLFLYFWLYLSVHFYIYLSNTRNKIII